MSEMDLAQPDVAPAAFWQAIKQVNPMFADKDQQGRPKQQDADECFSTILQNWREPLKKNAAGRDLIANLFEIELENETKCLESPDEPSAVTHENVLRLSCFIENGAKPVELLQDGLKMGLEG